MSLAPDTRAVSVRIRRVTTTRAGGVSAPPFDTFNLGDHVGDDPAAVAANRNRLAAAIGLGDRRGGLDEPGARRPGRTRRRPDRRPDSAVEDTDALVTTTPRLALAVVTADCVPVLMADARAGVVAAVHAGRVGAQKGVVARAVEAMLDAGAHAEDISVLLGPAVSGRNYEVPAAMADEVEAALPGSRTTTVAGHPGTGPAGRNRPSANGFGRHGHRRRPALHGGRPQPVQPSAGCARPDGWRRWCGWNDRLGNHAGSRTGRRAGPACANGSSAAAEAAGRNGAEIELLPITKFFPATDVVILSRLGCHAFGESREQEAAAKSAECNSAEPSAADSLAHGRPDSAQQGAVDRGWADAAHSVDSAKLVAALDRASGQALAEGGRSDPLRVYVQISLDGDVARGGVDIGRPDLVDELCAQVQSAAGTAVRRADGHPAAGFRPRRWPSRGCRPSTSGYSGTTSSASGCRPGCPATSNRGQTWFDVCACRYRAIGATTANVTMSSHSSHIFITDTSSSRRVQR